MELINKLLKYQLLSIYLCKTLFTDLKAFLGK